ncbi:MAG: two-component system response regulator [Halobacteriovoraceae bacterium]|nr:two-component system response regulator [Halobacteriovoraceae bacterium]
MDKVLLIDDTKSYRDKMGGVLRDNGLEVIEASSGEEALEKLAKEGDSFNLIVSDLHMEKLSGLDLAKIIKKDNITEVPIMMVTTETDDKLRDEGMQAGVRIWLIKPVGDQKFLKTVQMLLKASKKK